tara:strand:- start:22 stop:459 length:438 start_codon:yes stop_codon:yes gene_type:complete
MDDICNSLNFSFPKKDDDIIGNKISNITLTNKEEDRSEKAYSIYVSLLEFLETIHDKEYFECIIIIQHLSGIFYDYYIQLFPENWQKMYDHNCHNIDEYESIKANLEIIFNTHHTPNNIVDKLKLSKEIYLHLFRLSGVFPEFTH